MLSEFQKYVNDSKLFTDGQKVLLAVSGGADSVCMTHLLHKAKINIAIAHCNFQLRGDESDNEEQFVKELALQLNIPFHVMHFDTKGYAELQKLSIQIAARELRYNWFENLRRQLDFDSIAIAHNADDAAETFFINLFRGTGIQGITGIRSKVGNIIRPLLFAHKQQIEEFCTQNNFEFRTDSSNNSDKYLRNRIRHKLFPMLSELAPNFEITMHENLSKFADAENIYNYALSILKNVIVENDINGDCYINIEKLLETPAPSTIFFEIIKNYGFSPKTANEIFQNISGISGQFYYSTNFRLIKDREKFIINKIENKNVEHIYYIDPDSYNIINLPISISFEFIEDEAIEIIKDKNLAFLDAEKLTFPLILRKWKQGDYFQPLGMKGIKKLSDFFVDIKLSIPDKENCWLITSADQVVWIVGLRIDDRFKITSSTKRILKIEHKLN